MKTTTKILLTSLALTAIAAGPLMAQVPVLTVEAPGFGTWTFEGTAGEMVPITLAPNQPIAFSWVADLSGYGGEMKGYRAGWDLTDPDDPNDPGWLHPDHGPWLSADPQSFANGLHTFHVEAKDTVDGLTRVGFLLDVQEGVADEATSFGAVKGLFRR